MKKIIYLIILVVIVGGCGKNTEDTPKQTPLPNEKYVAEGLEFTNTKMASEGKVIQVTGTIRNTTKKSIDLEVVHLEFFNANDDSILNAPIIGKVLEPGEKWNYKEEWTHEIEIVFDPVASIKYDVILRQK